jgi:hypothetical protein
MHPRKISAHPKETERVYIWFNHDVALPQSRICSMVIAAKPEHWPLGDEDEE